MTTGAGPGRQGWKAGWIVGAITKDKSITQTNNALRKSLITNLTGDSVRHARLSEQEIRYQASIFYTLLLWAIVSNVLLSLANLYAYEIKPVWTALVLAVSFFVEIFVCLWCLKIVQGGETALPVRVFLGSAMGQVVLFLIFNNSADFLLGAMWGAMVIVVAVFMETSYAAFRWIYITITTYLAAAIVRPLLELPLIEFGMLGHLILYLVPAVLLSKLAFISIVTTRHLRLFLYTSEQGRLQLATRESELRRARDAAERANRTKGRFIANVSHELRTPLNAILGFVQLMERDSNLNDDQHKSLQIIAQSGEHLLALINDVLAVAKIETGQIELHENDFDLDHLLEEMQTLFRLRLREKKLQFLVERDPEVPRYLYGDEAKLRQVLLNLISNAIKFTSEGGIALRVRSILLPRKPIPESGDTLFDQLAFRMIFEVEDTGQGIGQHELENLFKPFIQTESGQKLQEGTGLGLAISSEYVHLMGGEITIKSERSKGTTVTFDIHVKAGDPNLPEKRSYDRRVIGLKPGQPKYKILVAEDRPESRNLLVRLMQMVGIEVRDACDGAEAYLIWQQWKPDLIWMDMRMPVVDGYEATRRIKRHPDGAKTIVIALTASTFRQEQTAVYAAGCTDYVNKPFKESSIFEKLEEHLKVEFVYEDLHERLYTLSSDGLTVEQLQRLSAEQLNAIEQTANLANQSQMNEFVNQLEDRGVAAALRQMVDEFRFDQILKLVEEAKQRASHD